MDEKVLDFRVVLLFPLHFGRMKSFFILAKYKVETKKMKSHT